MALVACVRKGGVQIPEPDANNSVDESKVNLNDPHVRAVATACRRRLPPPPP